MRVIEARGLSKVFTQKVAGEKRIVHAVDSVTFEVEEGEALAFIGPNGAGKSTTIKILTGIMHPSSGEATVLGRIPWKERRKLNFSIGAVFGQKSQLWMHLAPRHTFDLLASAYELETAVYRKRRDELVALFELQELLELPVRKMSLGQRMRCEIAASLLHDPKILFLDEPTIGLDPVAKVAIRDLIKRANKEKKVTVFLTSHDASDIEHLCRRVVIINHGRIVMDDSVKALSRNFLKHKTVDLKLNDEFQGSLDIPGAEVIKSSRYGLKLKVHTEQVPISQVVTSLLQNLDVLDIAIENPAMEEIIAEIYKNRV